VSECSEQSLQYKVVLGVSFVQSLDSGLKDLGLKDFRVKGFRVKGF
jgi:hypothetical protein